MKPLIKRAGIGCFIILGTVLSIALILFFRRGIEPGNYNVLLVTLDSARPDHFGCYGYARDTTPFIDSIATDGSVFLNAYAQSSSTPQSLSTILTAAMPNKHHMVGWENVLNPACTNLPSILRKHGYETIFISPNLVRLKGFAEGFSQFLTPDLNGEMVTFKIIDFLEGNPKKKFFIWVHYFDTHFPYRQSTLYPASVFSKDALFDENRKARVSTQHITAGPVKGIPAGAVDTHNSSEVNPDQYIAQYDSSLRAADQYVGMLVAVLKATRRYENTLIIISADHGEMLGEKGYYFQHGNFLYQALIHVPLIVKCKGKIPGRKKHAYPLSAHLVIAPTILDILGIPKAESMQGVSLMQVLYDHEKPLPREIYSDEGGNAKSLIEDGWKLIYNDKGNRYELYNLLNDPHETKDMQGAEPVHFNELKKKLDKYQHYDPAKDGGAAVLSDTDRQKLKSLGYMQ